MRSDKGLNLACLHLVLILSLISLTGCGGRISDGRNHQENSSLIVPGVTECEEAGQVSSDGKYVCAGRGAFYWVSLKELATDVSEQTADDDSSGGTKRIPEGSIWSASDFETRLIDADFSFALDRGYETYFEYFREYRVHGIFSSDALDCTVWLFSSIDDARSLEFETSAPIYYGKKLVKPEFKGSMSYFEAHGKQIAVVGDGIDDEACFNVVYKAFS